jgi:hypothetical protein
MHYCTMFAPNALGSIESAILWLPDIDEFFVTPNTVAASPPFHRGRKQIGQSPEPKQP